MPDVTVLHLDSGSNLEKDCPKFPEPSAEQHCILPAAADLLEFMHAPMWVLSQSTFDLKGSGALTA